MISWQSVSEPPPLIKNYVHLWKFKQDSFRNTLAPLSSLLSEDELKRASKFRFDKDRLTYIVARGNLRKLLSKYLNIPGHAINFKYNSQSKPFIDSKTNLKFNVSHSGGIILVGFVLEHDIGVDIEFDKKQVETAQVAQSFFSRNETSKLLSLPEKEQLQAFYNCWTRKEAFIKAKGGGLSIPLDQFEVSLLPDESPELKIIRWDPADVSNWQLKSFKIDKDYTAATIVSNSVLQYKCFEGTAS
ncbi:4'-phosphopantetheinyl transferase family protein [Roseivirga sp.]|uniref:4'-phosphopantetheinyl transferase family protein n=1 Tax=Roseivirga sp. TaxID=1964215 RepID=UPI003B8B9B89